MKIISSLVALGFTAFAAAQIAPAEMPIQDSMARLRAQPKMILQLDGTDNHAGRIKTFSSTSFFEWDPLASNSKVFADIFEFADGFPSRRITGNGDTVFAYTNADNTYTSTIYGSEMNPQPRDAKGVMLLALVTEARGTSIYVVRFLKEIFGGDSASYHTWLPGAQVQTISAGTVVKDKISGRVYAPGGDDFYILYLFEERLKRSCAFHLARVDATKPFEISEVIYTDIQKMGSSERILSWTMTVNPLTTATTNYTFIPPRTARAIANRRPGG